MNHNYSSLSTNHLPGRFFRRNRQRRDRSFPTICLASILVIAALRNVDCFASSFQPKHNSIAARKDHRNCNSRNSSNRLFSNTSPSTAPTTTDTTSASSSSSSTTTSPQPQQPQQQQLGAIPICVYHQVDVPSSEANPVPRQAISVEDLTPTLQKLLEESGMKDGLVTVISRHTTTSLTINEWESRLTKDISDCFLKLVPPDERSSSPSKQPGVTYQHNDIDLRPFGEDDHDTQSEEAQRCRENGWDVDDPKQLQAWRDQEPINSHSHLLSILGGSGSESIPVVDGQMVLGQWQSVLLLDLDGPRDRTVGVQLMGYVPPHYY